jgi:AcrR family transcriptional regulator
MTPSLRDQHAEATRRALLDAARKLFTAKGYEASGVDEIAAAAGATRGAVYHHFKGKRELLLALLDEVQGELVQSVARATVASADPWDRLRRGIAAFLDACGAPEVRRIVFRDAPAVLGWEAWREIDARHFLGLTVSAIRDLIQGGWIAPLDPETLAHLIMAALTEGVLMIERDADPSAARSRVESSVMALLQGLRTERAGNSSPPTKA